MTLLKGKSSLSKKLKEAVADLSVDIFGYEKTVRSNIINHTCWYSDKLRISSERLQLRIFLHRGSVKAFLHDEKRALMVLTPKELVPFFMDTSLVELDERLSKKVVSGIVSYLKNYATNENIPLEYLRVRIGVKEQEIQVNMFSYATHLETIPLKQIIKYFKR
ncbi:hypothetical protein [Aquimarina agarilytica]|uniref:hypothetical protein n=1 Tax=Aquimarina agarilytica TaxID=1087449 RepID=UPI0002895488|nr:hypothetical protein [Aquimarina agarilytica]